MAHVRRCQSSRFGLFQVRSTLAVSASSQTMRAATSSGGGTEPSYPNEPGRKSTPRLSPMLALSRSWTSSSASYFAICASSVTRASRGTGIPSRRPRAGDLGDEDLRDEDLDPLAGAPELQDVDPVVVRLDQPGERAALPQGRDVAGRRDALESGDASRVGHGETLATPRSSARRSDTSRGPRLVVMSREVGQSGDWWFASDGGVGAVVIVEVQPAGKGGVALLG